MATLRLFTDEDIYAAIAPALRNAGVDAVSTPESGRVGESDKSQLTWAVEQQRAIVTFNVAHFVRLHTEWVAEGEHHFGIVVSQQRPIGDLLRRLVNLSTAADPQHMRDRLEFLGSW